MAAHEAAAGTALAETPENTPAHRAFDPEDGTPLVLIQRFRCAMDDWDPAFLDALAGTRWVVVYDGAGIEPTRFFASSNVPDATHGQFEAMAGQGSPQGRAGTPEQQAEAAVFLASDATRFMTAADLVVDGGWVNV